MAIIHSGHYIQRPWYTVPIIYSGHNIQRPYYTVAIIDTDGAHTHTEKVKAHKRLKMNVFLTSTRQKKWGVKKKKKRGWVRHLKQRPSLRARQSLQYPVSSSSRAGGTPGGSDGHQKFPDWSIFGLSDKQRGNNAMGPGGNTLYPARGQAR